MRLAFGPWEPDSAAVDMRDQSGRAIMAKAENVYPLKTGYGPVPSLADYSTFALPATCVGLAYARTTAGTYKIFAGTATKLYYYDSTLGWVDYTRTVGGNYSVPSGDFWSFAQFGSQLIACNVNDNPQVIDVDTGAVAFSALGGTPPKARYVGVVGDFLILACQNGFPLRVTNSAINSTTGWTVGVNLCDQQDFPDSGKITGISGGEYGWILQEHAIRRMIFQPGYDQAFRFERIERFHGAAAGYSVVSVADTVYFLANDGFYSFGPQGLNNIGSQRVNQWFTDNSDATRFFSVMGTVDPLFPRIYWAFYNTNTSTVPDRVLIYDWHLDQWSYMISSAQGWAQAVTTGISLESLNTYGSIDTGVPFSLDSQVWAGGQPVMAAITSAGHLAFLSGATPMTGTLLTCPLQMVPESRCNVQNLFPIGVFNNATIAARVGKRENTSNAVAYTASLSPSPASGFIRTKASGRLHEFELTLSQTSGSAWKHAEGLEIDVNQDGLK